MINGETMVVLITIVGSIIKSRYRFHGRVAEQQQQLATDPDAARLHDEVRILKDRIQVLERVITDNHSTSDLDREIERLRDRS